MLLVLIPDPKGDVHRALLSDNVGDGLARIEGVTTRLEAFNTRGRSIARTRLRQDGRAKRVQHLGE